MPRAQSLTVVEPSPPLPSSSEWLHRWLYRLKTYFLLVHATYIVAIMFLCAISIYISETYWPVAVQTSGGGGDNLSLWTASFPQHDDGGVGNTTATVNPSPLPPQTIAFIDALFVASSAVSCTGLSTVDVSQWNRFSAFCHNIATVLGGMVFTSGAMPLLRLFTLRKLRGEICAKNEQNEHDDQEGIRKEAEEKDDADSMGGGNVAAVAQTVAVPLITRDESSASLLSPTASSSVPLSAAQTEASRLLLKQWNARKLIFISRLETTAILSAAVTYGYLIFWHVVGFVVFWVVGGNGAEGEGGEESGTDQRARPSIPFSDAIEHTIAAFQNCGFVAMNPFAKSSVIVFALAWLNAVGGALYPILLRGVFVGSLKVAWLAENLKLRYHTYCESRKQSVQQRQEEEQHYNTHAVNSTSSSGASCASLSSFPNGEHRANRERGGEENGEEEEEEEIDEGVVARRSFFGGDGGSFALSRNVFDAEEDDDSDGTDEHLFGDEDSGEEESDDEDRDRDGPEREKKRHGKKASRKRNAPGGKTVTPPFRSQRSIWEGPITRHLPQYYKGLLTIVYAREPSLYHFFLFKWHDTLYLLVAFILINAAQMLPFLIQQWGGDSDNGVLALFPPGQKVLVALAQSILVRFSGTTLVDVLQFSYIHILWTLFAMYIPVVPIPTDRGRKRWKKAVALMKVGFLRLLTSRLFVLFLSTSIIVWIEEDRLKDQTIGTRFDLLTRVLFEVVSGYATSGMTLPLAGSVASFSSSLSNVSKLIVTLNMLLGRHRWMDLGIDIGLDVLVTSERQVARKQMKLDRQARLNIEKQREESPRDYSHDLKSGTDGLRHRM